MEIELKFKEGFIRYKKGLEEQLNKATQERQALIEKFTKGELLTAEDAQRNKRLADTIAEIKRALEKVAEVEFYDNVEKTLIALANPALTTKQKDSGINFVKKSFLAFNQDAIRDLSSVTDLTPSELKNISHTITVTKRKITELRYEIFVLKKHEHDTAELEVQKQFEEDRLQILEQFKGIIFNEIELEESLRSLANNKTPEGVKESTIKRYRQMIKKHKDLKIDNLVLDIKKHPITNLDEEPIIAIEQKTVPEVIPVPEVTPAIEQQPPKDEKIEEKYYGPRLLDRTDDTQYSFIPTPIPRLDFTEKKPVQINPDVEEEKIITPTPSPISASPEFPWLNNFLEDNIPENSDEDIDLEEPTLGRQDEIFRFNSPKKTFTFPEPEEEELDKSPIIETEEESLAEEPKPENETLIETHEAEDEELEETPDAEYEVIDEEFEMEDNSLMGKAKKGYHKFKDWLFGGYDYEDYELDDEYEDEDEFAEDPNSFKNKTKARLAKVGGWLKKSWKPIVSVTGAVIMVYALCTAFKGCKKDESVEVKPEDFTSEPTIETTIETTHANATINNLIDKGYSEYNAILMADNFDSKTLDTVLSNPYNAAVENYSTIKSFNYNYLNDYENAREIYGITSDKAVDYVNRSYQIMDTGFYTDLTINEIVGVVKAVDDKQIFLDETNPYNHSITAALTNIYNDYAFGTGSIDASLKKIEALKYFAPEGSDLDAFLTKFTEITKSVLKSRGNATVSEDAKQTMYNYLNIFANTFAGNTQDFNNPDQNAVVTDTFDWNTAYITFIRPLMSMYITETNAEEFACLQINMLSNYEQWVQINEYCNEEETIALG